MGTYFYQQKKSSLHTPQLSSIFKVVMGHSFLYAQNYMFSRNAFFYKVNAYQTYPIYQEFQTIVILFIIFGSHQAGLYTETGMAMMALREAPLLTHS